MGARRDIVTRSVFCDDDGVSQCECVGGREDHQRLAWGEVKSVLGYKQDCYGFDRMCIALLDANGQTRVNVSEDDAGYQALVLELPKRLVGCPTFDEWFPRVALPAFKTQMTELYRRPSATT